MKNLYLGILLIIFIASCRNSDTLIEEIIIPESMDGAAVTLAINGYVGEYNSIYHFRNGRLGLHDVSVKLMYNDVALDEVNTDKRGRFQFVEQMVPVDGAYLLYEAPSFYKNVSKIDTTYDSSYYSTLIRKTYAEVQGEAISTGGPYINISGELQENTPTSGLLYYFTNELNQLVGAGGGSGDFTNFNITTVADQHLLLHYSFDCFEGSFQVGPFSEDTDIGALLDQSVDLSMNWDFVSVKAYACDGSPIDDYGIHYQVSGLTNYTYNSSGSGGFGDFECLLEEIPAMAVTVATQNPRKYNEQIITYSTGQNLSLDMTLCEDDDTFLNYSIGGDAMVVPDLFTFANILPDGRLLLKQVHPEYVGGISKSFESLASVETGSSTLANVYFTSYLPTAQSSLLGGSNIAINITSNDGNFIEGTFNGPVFDTEETSLGNLIGSFRARIQ